jgi:hypothetical protein
VIDGEFDIEVAFGEGFGGNISRLIDDVRELWDKKRSSGTRRVKEKLSWKSQKPREKERYWQKTNLRHDTIK